MPLPRDCAHFGIPCVIAAQVKREDIVIKIKDIAILLTTTAAQVKREDIRHVYIHYATHGTYKQVRGRPHLHRDWARPRPHLRRDWPRPRTDPRRDWTIPYARISRVGLTPAHIGAGTALGLAVGDTQDREEIALNASQLRSLCKDIGAPARVCVCVCVLGVCVHVCVCESARVCVCVIGVCDCAGCSEAVVSQLGLVLKRVQVATQCILLQHGATCCITLQPVASRHRLSGSSPPHLYRGNMSSPLPRLPGELARCCHAHTRRHTHTHTHTHTRTHTHTHTHRGRRRMRVAPTPT